MSDKYDVGYGKPPKHTQFKKGTSGNPAGRPKGTRNLKTDLREELQQKLVIREGGRERTVSKQQAVVMRLVEKAIKGEIGATKTLLGMAERLDGLDAIVDDHDAPLSADEREVWEGVQARLVQRANAAAEYGLAQGEDEEEKDDG